jgi:hypothetical protein
MPPLAWVCIALAALVLLVLLRQVWRWPPLRRRLFALQRERLDQLFQRERSPLQETFLHAAAASGRPRGVRWVACEWDDGVRYARHRADGLYLALVGVTIRFEAIPGSEMEEVEAVDQAKTATGVFFFDRGRWQTGGKAIFNLFPDDVLRHFEAQYEAM